MADEVKPPSDLREIAARALGRDGEEDVPWDGLVRDMGRKFRLRQARHGDSWRSMGVPALFARALDEMAELGEACRSGDAQAVREEAADVAVVLSFIWRASNRLGPRTADRGARPSGPGRSGSTGT